LCHVPPDIADHAVNRVDEFLLGIAPGGWPAPKTLCTGGVIMSLNDSMLGQDGTEQTLTL
jgi:hypothetical protein